MSDWIQRYVDAIRRAYPELPPEIAAYLDTFEAESAANHEAREVIWRQFDPMLREQLIDLSRQENPQLFN